MEETKHADLLNVTVLNRHGKRVERYWLVAVAGAGEKFPTRREALAWAKQQGATAFHYDHETL